jgi:small subunit ribosomal protein S28
MSTKFLGSTKDMTLLEADCYILGILSSPTMPKTSRTTSEPLVNVAAAMES